MVWGGLRTVSFILLGIVISSSTNAATVNPQRIIPGSYIVEFEDSDESPDTFHTTLSSRGIGATLRLDLSYPLFKGASFQLDDVRNEKAAVEMIASMSNVKRISPNYVYHLPRDEFLAVGDGVAVPGSGFERREFNENVYAPHAMIGVDKLHAEGYSGKGINVALIDTGVDYNHPDLGGCFGEGCKISYGYDLVGDDFVSDGIPKPDDDPYDNCDGHGTHVAGILAGNMNQWNFSGVAPDVTLGMYRAISCVDQSTSDIMIQAHMMAYEAGADIISMSAGYPNGWSEGPLATSIQRIVEAGVPCSIALGNSGTAGLFSSDGPGDADRVTGVASVYNTDRPIYVVDGAYEVHGSEAMSFGWTPAQPSIFPNGTYPLYAISYNSTALDDACESLPKDTPDLSKSLVLARASSVCGTTEQISNIAASGGRFIMFYSDYSGTVQLQYSEARVAGVGMITREQGAEWVSLLAEDSSINVQITDPKFLTRGFQMSKNTDTGGYLSVFTSWGPTFGLDFKPQFAAPGGYILSAWPLSRGGYSIGSGTSMACPFVTGVIALLLEARGKTDPATINNILGATANPNIFFDGTDVYPYLAPVVQQGSGLINAYDAVHTETILSVSSISLNDTEHFKAKSNFTIQNAGSQAVTYELAHVSGPTIYTLSDHGPAPYPFGYGGVSPEIVESAATLEFSSTSVTIAAGESAVVEISPTPPSDLITNHIPVYGGYITLNGTNGDSLSLPYMGVASVMRNATVMNTYADFVYLGSTTGRIEAGHVFTLPPADAPIAANDTRLFPKIWTGLALGTAILRVDVKSTTGTDTDTVEILGEEVVGSVLSFPRYYVPRDLSDGWVWFGQLEGGHYLPTGNYTLIIRALKIFGDVDNPDDYELVETPEFRIEYDAAL